MKWNDEIKNVQGMRLFELFKLICDNLGLTSYKDCTELLGAVTMFYLQAASESLDAPMEELREEYVESLNNAYFEKQ